MAATIEQPVVTRPRRVVEISPNTDLHFYPPEGGSRDSVAVLTLRNISDGFTLFKIKTTAPKRYCVRPNCGRIATGDTATVQVLLQPPFPPVLGETEKPHKFLVQTMPIPADADATTPAQNLWKSLERRDNIVEQRLKCHWFFDLPPKGAVTASNLTPAAVPEKAPASKTPPAAAAPAISPASISPAAAAAIAKSIAPAAPAAAPAASTTPAVTVSSSSPPARPASPPKQAPAAAPASPAAKPANAEISSQLRRRIKPDNAGAVATAGSAPAAKPALTATAEHQPILIIIVFLLGVLFGKFVL